MEPIIKKLDDIEKGILNLKFLLEDKKKKKRASMKGILKDVAITEDDIEEAKKSLFRQ